MVANNTSQPVPAVNAVPIYSTQYRHGLGPRIDPSYDAEVGRVRAALASGQTRSSPARGYIELLTRRDGVPGLPWTPYDQLVALFAVVYGLPTVMLRRFVVLRIGEAPLVWTQITRLRYLTTDSVTGVALPLYSFNPDITGSFKSAQGALQFFRQLRRLRRLTDGKLERASAIGLTVDFDFTVGAERLAAALPSLDITKIGEPLQRPRIIDEILFGKGGAGSRSQDQQHMIDTHDLALSGGVSAHLKNAMRELRFGNCYPSTPVPSLDYGMSETGRGVIVGVVDFGCDFAHPSFCDATDRTRSRILTLWDQNDHPETDLGTPIVAPDPPAATVNGEVCQFGFGRVFTRDKINHVLKQWREGHADDRAWPYRALGYDPNDNYYVSRRPEGVHGTLVLDIAAGGRRSCCPNRPPDNPTVAGVAPQSDLVFVQIRTERQPDGRRVLDANDVVDAVAFIFHLADRLERPCAVNVSLNTMSGPHDGDGHLERRLAALMRSGRAGGDVRGRSMVIAAGNLPYWETAGRYWQHISDQVTPDHPFEFFWNLSFAKSDLTRNSLEIWYDASDAWLEVSLEHPTAGPVATVGPGLAAEISDAGRVVGSVIGSRFRPLIRDNDELRKAGPRLPESDFTPGRHVIFISLDPHPNGLVIWKIKLKLVSSSARNRESDPGAGPVRFHAWLERDDEGQTGIARTDDASDSSQVSPQDRPSTLGTLSCGDEPIVVTAYDASHSIIRLSPHSAQGPPRHQQIAKPDIAAPGEWIWLAQSKADNTCVWASGTSLAAPFVTGTIACLYEIEPQASMAQIKEVLFSTARKDIANPPGAWCPQLGWGRLDPQAALAELHRRASAAAAPA
jgi:hypothetical protein